MSDRPQSDGVVVCLDILLAILNEIHYPFHDKSFNEVLATKTESAMIDRFKVECGDKVHYNPEHGEKENGIVKAVHPSGEGAWVVYHCANDWPNFMDYTGELTAFSDLESGWV